MKYTIIVILIFLKISFLFGQIPYEVVVPSINDAWRITVVEENDKMYVTTYSGFKEVNLLNTQATPIDRNDIIFLISAGDSDYLYFIRGYDPIFDPNIRLIRANPNESTINYEEFGSTPGFPGTSIYSVPLVDEFHFYFDYGGVLHRKRLNSNESVQKYLLANAPCDVLSMAKNNGRMYVGEIGCSGNIPDIYTIDVNDANPEYTLFLEDIGRVFSMQYRFGYLYFIREYWDGSQLSNVISRVPVDNPSLATVEDLSEEFSGNQVKQMQIYNGTIFFVNDTGNIYKLSETLSTLDNSKNSYMSLYPNPAKDGFKISGIYNKNNYVIFNVLGLKVMEGSTSPNDIISVNQLATGVYFVKIEGTDDALRLVKQ
ncbi:MAG: hypothetical protein CMC13_08705 [Flavobacteriaceae bacterium]|nr:hypothetical protein [Flavobacteriaceae bacterium]|tara:strand:+ start:26178 stop:27290 length:1113 start_codon:yes stop_codon:yes gene_type:complete